MFCQALLSDGFFLWDLCCLEELRFGREIFGSDEGGGELDGGSNKSERSEAEPGEKGESKSMSIGEPPSALKTKFVLKNCGSWKRHQTHFNFIGRTADTFAGKVVYRGCLNKKKNKYFLPLMECWNQGMEIQLNYGLKGETNQSSYEIIIFWNRMSDLPKIKV